MKKSLLIASLTFISTNVCGMHMDHLKDNTIDSLQSIEENESLQLR